MLSAHRQQMFYRIREILLDHPPAKDVSDDFRQMRGARD